MVEKVKKGRGRPRAPEDERRPENLTLKVRSDIKEALEGHAAETGRSLSAETEAWLSQAFLSKGVLNQALDLAFGHQLAGVILLLGACIRDTATVATNLVGTHIEPFDDPRVFNQMAQAAARIFDALRPPATDNTPYLRSETAPGHQIDQLGFDIADGALGRVANLYPNNFHNRGTMLAVRERLGPHLLERIAAQFLSEENQDG